MAWDWTKTRQTKYGAYSAVYILVALAIIVTGNYLANRYNKTFDATKDKLYSLSDQTKKILDNLESDLTIYYFDKNSEFGAARNSLQRYANASSRVHIEYIDPDSKPEVATAMNVRTYGTVLVGVGTNREEAKSADEEQITNTIIRVLKGEEKTACILSGHGEADVSDSERDGFSGARQAIEGANYKTKSVSLLETPEVPADCTLLILPGPKTGYLQPEIDTFKRYIEGGGRALLLLDPDASPELAEMLAGWGVRVHNETIIDFSPFGQVFGMGPLSPLVAGYEPHPITDVMGKTATFFPMARGVDAGDAVAGWDVQELFKTTESSFGTKEVKIEDGELVRDPNGEREGPITLAVAATHKIAAPGRDAATSNPGEEPGSDSADSEAKDSEAKEARVVVVGSSRFARNYALGRGGNVDLILNMLSWLSSDEDLISIRPKDPENTPLNISQAQMMQLFWLNVVGLPLVIVLFGVQVWWKRR